MHESGLQGRIDSIDSLRAFAMTAVILQHCGLLPFGWIGVWFFFVISGFVVTTSLLERAPSPAQPHALMEFFVRRGARIFPIYFCISVVCLIASLIYTGVLQWRPFFSLILFYFNFEQGFGYGGFTAGPFSAGHLWTVSVEMQFYLFFGVAFVFLSRRALTYTLVSLLFLAPVFRLLVSILISQRGIPPLNAAFFIYTFSLLHFDSFSAGALLALLRFKGLPFKWSLGLLMVGVAVTALYCAAYIAVNHFVRGDVGAAAYKNVISGILFGQYREVFLYSALAMLSAGIVAVTATGSPLVSALLGNRSVQWLVKFPMAAMSITLFSLLWVHSSFTPH